MSEEGDGGGDEATCCLIVVVRKSMAMGEDRDSIFWEAYVDVVIDDERSLLDLYFFNVY